MSDIGSLCHLDYSTTAYLACTLGRGNLPVLNAGPHTPVLPRLLPVQFLSGALQAALEERRELLVGHDQTQRPREAVLSPPSVDGRLGIVHTPTRVRVFLPNYRQHI